MASVQSAGVLLPMLCAALAAAQLHAAQRESTGEYPSKPVRMVVPSAAGSGTDMVGRMIGQGLNGA